MTGLGTSACQKRPMNNSVAVIWATLMMKAGASDICIGLRMLMMAVLVNLLTGPLSIICHLFMTINDVSVIYMSPIWKSGMTAMFLTLEIENHKILIFQ